MRHDLPDSPRSARLSHAVRVRQRFILAGERRGGDWAIIKPELTPPFFRNGGNCDALCLSIIGAMRAAAPIARRFRYRQRQIIRRHGNRFSMEVTAGITPRIGTAKTSDCRTIALPSASSTLFRLT